MGDVIPLPVPLPEPPGLGRHRPRPTSVARLLARSRSARPASAMTLITYIAPAAGGPVSGPDPDYRGFQEQAGLVRDDALDLVESAFRWVHDGLAGGDADAEATAVIILSDIDQGVPLSRVL